MTGGMRFVLNVVDIAGWTSVATKCRRYLEEYPETFALIMNELSQRSLTMELNEQWDAYLPRKPVAEYFDGHPIYIAEELPDGLVLGGD